MSPVFHVENNKLRKDVSHLDFFFFLNRWTLKTEVSSGTPGLSMILKYYHSDPDNEVSSHASEHGNSALLPCLPGDQYIYLSLFPSILGRIVFRGLNIQRVRTCKMEGFFFFFPSLETLIFFFFGD